MKKKHILGIYIDRDSLEYVSAVKGVTGYSLGSPGAGYSTSGKQQGNGYSLLKSFLTDLSPDSARSVYLALPRSQIFAREIDMPAMPVEDALLSVKNSLAIYSHLEPEKIYYDIYLVRCHGDGVKMLLFYAAKSDIEKYQKIFSDTGHTVSLKGIFPVSYGIAALFYKGASQLYTGFCLNQEDVSEIFVCSEKNFLFTMTVPLYEDEKAFLMKSAAKKFPGIGEKICDLNFSQGQALSGQYQKKMRFLPDLHDNIAVGAVAPALCKVQQISVDFQPVRIRFIHPVRYIIPFICIMMIGLYSLTDNLNKKVNLAESDFNKLKIKVTELAGELEPLEKKIETLKKAASFKQDVKKIIKTKPKLFSAINEIASLVPDGTWFAGFSYHKNKIVLRGRGSYALKTVELLRSSDMFSNVALKGSVNRSAVGDERFSIVLQIKDLSTGEQND